MSLLTLTIIAIICVIFLIVGILTKSFYDGIKNTCLIIGVVGLIVLGLFGFGFYATKSEDTMMVEKLSVDTVIKSNTTVYVEILNEETLEFTTKKSYDEINDSTVFYKVSYYNHYGIEIDAEIRTDTILKPYVDKGKMKSIYE